MTYTLVGERSVGDGLVALVERIYRCDNDYGLIVVTEPPGSEEAGRMTVTPIVFEGEAPDSYLVVSRGNELREGLDGDLLEPRVLQQEEELAQLLERLSALPAYVPDEDAPL